MVAFYKSGFYVRNIKYMASLNPPNFLGPCLFTRKLELRVLSRFEKSVYRQSETELGNSYQSLYSLLVYRWSFENQEDRIIGVLSQNHLKFVRHHFTEQP